MFLHLREMVGQLLVGMGPLYTKSGLSAECDPPAVERPNRETLS